MYCRPKILGLNTTLNQIFVVFYASTNAIYIINIHCFRAVVQITCSKKSAKSETSNFGFHFLRFSEMPLQKNVKSRIFWIFKKNVKNAFSNYDPYSLQTHKLRWFC